MDAFDHLFAAHRPGIERYIRFRISNPADAEDVLQEVFLAAVKGYATLHDSARTKHWLVSIARNKCADYFRRSYRQREVPLDSADRIAILPPRFASAKDSLVMDTLETLSPQDQQMLRLYYFLQLPQQEIARRLQLPPGTVNSRLHHARELARLVLEKD